MPVSPEPSTTPITDQQPGLRNSVHALKIHLQMWMFDYTVYFKMQLFSSIPSLMNLAIANM